MNGHGVIAFNSESSADEALKEMNNTTVGGSKLRLHYYHNFFKLLERADPRTHDVQTLQFRFGGSLEDLKEAFREYYEGDHIDRIEFCKSALFVCWRRALTSLVKDKVTGETTTGGLITFHSERSASEARSKMDGTTIEGSALRLEFFRKPLFKGPWTDRQALDFRFDGSLKDLKNVFHKYYEGDHIDRIEFCESALLFVLASTDHTS